MRLDGKVAVITGADRGIGRATVATFLTDGARVVAADLGPTGCAEYADDPRVAIVFGDVSVRADAERIIATALERFGRLDVLVNNAGIVDRFLPVGELTDELWNRVLAVNLTGPMLLARAAMPHLIASKGVVVNISSVGGLFGARAGAAYVSSKHGLIGLTKNIAATYASEGVRAVAVAPGGVNTGIGLGGEPSPRGLAALNKTLAANVRLAEPSEIASVVAFAASSDASFVNGEVLVVDGGWTAY
ncbi:MAG TPA: SDR family oxidoreductase [Candidatus Limnocylindria bacterium]|nr:SDR family oxidoreductase [Candidatus Limnocylindria bacterium]